MTETRAPFNGKKKEPAGVFIRLHDGMLNAKQIALLCRPNRSFTENILAISSPVIGREMEYEATVVHYEAKLAERNAEIMRLQNALRGIINTAHNLPEFMCIEIMQKEAEEALKGPEA